MANIWDISAGSDDNLTSLRPLVKTLGKSAMIVGPALLFSNVAFAADPIAIAYDPATLKIVKNTRKSVTIMKKGSSAALAYKTCMESGKSVLELKHFGGSTPAIAIAYTLTLLCGAFLVLTYQTFVEDDD